MKTLLEVAARLESERQRQKITYTELAQATGLSVLAVRQALQGKTAARVTSMMALADRLGLEMVLLPKEVAGAMDHTRAEPVKPALTSVERALQGGNSAAGGDR